MRVIDVGGRLPAIVLRTAADAALDLHDYLGGPLVLYFYPKDDTPGCTREARDFSAIVQQIRDLGGDILGVSEDTTDKHARFIAKHDLAVPLASDVNHIAVQAFGVWVEKRLYGRTYMGIDRSTFLFDTHGMLARVWRKVRVPGHADQVLEALKELA